LILAASRIDQDRQPPARTAEAGNDRSFPGANGAKMMYSKAGIAKSELSGRTIVCDLQILGRIPFEVGELPDFQVLSLAVEE
jgi:hypothetical protein